MLNPLITVVVPIYNTESYLANCLDSILTQTYENLEILLIDDGSTDNSPEIAKAYVQKDSRVSVYQQENQGQAAARNHGLDRARGEYLIFVDSDDSLSETHVETLYKALSATAAPAAMCRPTRKKSELQTHLDPEMTLIEGTFAALLKNEDHAFARKGAWCKLYSREIYQQLRFPEAMIYEDDLFFYRLLDKIDRIALVHTTTYYYRLRQSSTVGGLSQKNFDIFKRNQLLEQFIRDKHPDCLEFIRAESLKMNDDLALKCRRAGTPLARALFDKLFLENKNYRKGLSAVNKPFYILSLYASRAKLEFKKRLRKLRKRRKSK